MRGKISGITTATELKNGIKIPTTAKIKMPITNQAEHFDVICMGICFEYG